MPMTFAQYLSQQMGPQDLEPGPTIVKDDAGNTVFIPAPYGPRRDPAIPDHRMDRVEDRRSGVYYATPPLPGWPGTPGHGRVITPDRTGYAPVHTTDPTRTRAGLARMIRRRDAGETVPLPVRHVVRRGGGGPEDLEGEETWADLAIQEAQRRRVAWIENYNRNHPDRHFADTDWVPRDRSTPMPRRR